MSSTASETEEVSEGEVSEGESLRTTLKLYGSFFAVLFFSFCIGRKRFPKAFNVRNWVPKLKCPLAQEQYGWISWMWKVYMVSEDDIQEQCGMDALCMLRLFYFGFRVSVVGILNSIYLMPIYATSPETEDNAGNDPLTRVSAMQVPPSNSRLIATAVGAYIFFGYCMYLILAEFKWFTQFRHQFLAKRLPRNYTVYVTGISVRFRSNQALLRYFKDCFSDEAVLEAHVTLKVPNLRKKQDERKKLIQKLEHVINLERRNGERPQLRKSLHSSTKVDAIDTYTQQLDILNSEIKDIIDRIEKMAAHDIEGTIPNTPSSSIDEPDVSSLPHSLSVLRRRRRSSLTTLDKVDPLYDYAEELRNLNRKIKRGIEKIDAMAADDGNSVFDSQESNSDLTFDSSSITRRRSMKKTATIEAYTDELSSLDCIVSRAIEKMEAMAAGRDNGESMNVVETSGDQAPSDNDTRPVLESLSTKADKRSVLEALSSKTFKPIESIRTRSRKGSRASTRMSVMLSKDEDAFAPHDAGFVTFTRLRTTHAALQMIHHHKPFKMDAVEAPDPHDIFWPNIGRTHRELQVGKLLGFLFTAFICLFWTLPVLFATSMSNVDALKGLLPFLESILDQFPFLEVVLAQLAPMFVYLLNELLPWILMNFAKLEGPISSSVLETSVFVKYAWFMIIQTFFVSAISGSIFRELETIVNNPTSAIDLLANALPAQAIYFVQILLVSTFIGLGMELLRVKPVAAAAIRRTIAGPNLSEKERNTRWMCFHPLADPIEFEYGVVFGEAILYFMVLFVYSTLAPITNYFLAFFFVLLGCGYRHQFIYIYPPSRDSGGKLWTGFISIAISCILISEFILLGWLGIKKAPIAALLMFPLIIGTICFRVYIQQKHFYVTNHLPTPECLKLDVDNQARGLMDFSFAHNAYLQPALKIKEEFPEPDIWQQETFLTNTRDEEVYFIEEGFEDMDETETGFTLTSRGFSQSSL